MFGSTNTSFGGGPKMFGSNTSTFGAPQQGTSTFGMNQINNSSPASFGAFGANATSAPVNSSGMIPSFGMNANNNTSSPFGQPANNNAGASMFGNNSLNSTASSAIMGSQSGTALKPFTEYQEKDNTTNTMNHFQSISCMPEYSNFSFEELRFQDYQANRKFANSPVSAGSQFGSNTSTGGFGNMLGNSTAQSAGSGSLFGQPTSAQNSPFGSVNSNNTTSSFGSAFGSNAAANTNTNAFGNNTNSQFGMNKPSTGVLFGQSNSEQGGGLFGQSSNPQSGFGANNNAFGSSNTNTGGLYGQNNNAQQQGGLFGQNNNAQQHGGLFGQNNNQQMGGSNMNKQASGGLLGQSNTGTFGQANNTQTPGGLFGQNLNQPQQQPGGLFGAKTATNAGGIFGAKPAGGLFGQGQTNSTFGSSANPAPGGLFGQKAPEQTPQTGGLFGQNNIQPQQQSGLFAQNNNNQQGGLFGQTNNQQQSSGLFGAKPVGTTNNQFSQNNNTQQQGGLFGQNTQQTQVQGGLFGQNNQQAQSQGNTFGQNNQLQQQSGGLFGAKPATTNGGLFGSNNSATQPSNTASTGLFGSQPASGGLSFGNSNPAGNSTFSAQPGNLFGGNTNNNTSAPGGLFGNKPQSTGLTSGGLFGNNNNTLSSGTQGGMFGTKPATSGSTLSGGGLFGANNVSNASTISTDRAFGNQTSNTILNSNTQIAQNSQMSAQTNNPYGTVDLFKRITIPESITAPTQATFKKIYSEKKATGLSASYNRSPKPLFSKNSSILSSEPRRNTMSTFDSPSSSSEAINFDVISSDSNSSLFSSDLDDAIIIADKLLFNPDRKSFKNLIINKRKQYDPTFNESNDSKNQNLQRITFSNHSSNNTGTDTKSGSIFDIVQGSPISNETIIKSLITEKSSPPLLIEKKILEKKINKTEARSSTIKSQDNISFLDDNYFISPSIEAFSSMSLLQLRKVSDLVVGHKYFGKIEFLDPVDLSNLPISSLCGKIIVFSSRTCIVNIDTESPENGSNGLNVRAKTSLYKCYPMDKTKREPVLDPEHVIVKRHIEKLKRLASPKFDSYEPQTGTYVFTVDRICP